MERCSAIGRLQVMAYVRFVCCVSRVRNLFWKMVMLAKLSPVKFSPFIHETSVLDRLRPVSLLC
jgi:hypothetical protein